MRQSDQHWGLGTFKSARSLGYPSNTKDMIGVYICLNDVTTFKKCSDCYGLNFKTPLYLDK